VIKPSCLQLIAAARCCSPLRTFLLLPNMAALADTSMLQKLMLVLCASGVLCDQVALTPGGSASLLVKEEPKINVADVFIEPKADPLPLLSSPLTEKVQAEQEFKPTCGEVSNSFNDYLDSHSSSEMCKIVKVMLSRDLLCCKDQSCCRDTAGKDRTCMLADVYESLDLKHCNDVASTVTAASMIETKVVEQSSPMAATAAPGVNCAAIAVVFGQTTEDPKSAPLFQQEEFCGSEGMGKIDPPQTPACCSTNDCCAKKICTLKDAYHACQQDLCFATHHHVPGTLSQMDDGTLSQTDDATRASEALLKKQMFEKEQQKLKAEEADLRKKIIRRVTDGQHK